MFVHTRNKEYLAQGHQVTVLVPDKVSVKYEIDGVKVIRDNVFALAKHLERADRIMIHLLLHRLDKATDAGYLYDRILEGRLPTLFFIHGVESQTIWNSRRQDIKWHNPKTVARWLYRDCYLIKRMIKTLIAFNQPGFPCKFVTPSKWMLTESMRHTSVDLTDKSLVIANGIDTEHFKFSDHWQHRHRLLSIRPLIYRGKYAVDLLLDSMKKVNVECDLSLYGNGTDEALIRQVAATSLTPERFTLKAQFIQHQDIPAIHASHGLYLAVTRMDAQGVSMCEAMASGLPTISFDTCAIPEFITHRKTGLLAAAYDTDEFSEHIHELIENRGLFDSLTQNARKAMEAIDVIKTTAQELHEPL
jgi:glycosyltransferase involved in cell wall biosynthesis